MQAADSIPALSLQRVPVEEVLAQGELPAAMPQRQGQRLKGHVSYWSGVDEVAQPELPCVVWELQ